ncbi:MAG TPA: hypothetical protein VEK38_03310 [Candidatus Bathyarchaeia archaeon]|nr:hypothetical protein [Candidatus Bathyarchaeia archaeon]
MVVLFLCMTCVLHIYAMDLDIISTATKNEFKYLKHKQECLQFAVDLADVKNVKKLLKISEIRVDGKYCSLLYTVMGKKFEASIKQLDRNINWIEWQERERNCEKIAKMLILHATFNPREYVVAGMGVWERARRLYPLDWIAKFKCFSLMPLVLAKKRPKYSSQFFKKLENHIAELDEESYLILIKQPEFLMTVSRFVEKRHIKK